MHALVACILARHQAFRPLPVNVTNARSHNTTLADNRVHLSRHPCLHVYPLALQLVLVQNQVE
jgi:hypothetical protein